jgi:hypothetical protein
MCCQSSLIDVTTLFNKLLLRRTHARAQLLRTQHTQDLTFAGVTGVIGSATVGVGEGPGTGAGPGSVTGSFVTGTSGGVTGGTTGFAVATTGGVTGASVAGTTTGGAGSAVAGTGASVAGGAGACCVVLHCMYSDSKASPTMYRCCGQLL